MNLNRMDFLTRRIKICFLATFKWSKIGRWNYVYVKWSVLFNYQIEINFLFKDKREAFDPWLVRNFVSILVSINQLASACNIISCKGG